MTEEMIPPREALFEGIQKTETYKDIVLSLRRGKSLHDFVVWVLKRTIQETFGERFSLQSEKYGISNGRIDLALYHAPRTIIHFELIATCSSGHVFRDTSSLLASRADERLAILIDEDLEANVSKNFFSAIPDGQVKYVPLREVLLDKCREKFVALVRELVDSAEFKNGSTDPSRFYCFFEGSEIGVFKVLRIEFHNAPVNDVLTIQLQQHESMFKSEHLASVKVLEPSGIIEVAIPYVPNTPGESYYLAAYLSSGERWRKRVHIRKVVEAPTVFVAPGEYSPLEEVRFSVRNFPRGAKIRTSISKGNHGQGCNHGQEITTNEKGCGDGAFIIPNFIGVERIQDGEYGLVVSTEGNIFRASAETVVNVKAAEASQKLWRPIAIMTNNYFASAALRGLGFGEDEIEVEYELTNLCQESLTFMSCSLMIRNNERQFINIFVGDFRQPAILHSGQSLARKDRFIRLEAPEETKAERASILDIRLTIAIGAFPEILGQVFTLTLDHSLWESEAEALFGRSSSSSGASR